MADAILNIKITKDDAALKEIAAQLSSVFGGATLKKFEETTKKAYDGLAADSKISADKQASQIAEAGKRMAASSQSTQELIKSASERRIKAEESAEKLKFEQLKEEYKKNAKAIDDLNNAKKEAATKEAKAEIQIELNKAKELQQIYRKELSERPETKKGKASDVGMLGTGRETEGFSVKGLVEIGGIGAALEGLKSLTEKSDEVAKAQKQLQIGTGLSGKELEETAKRADKLGESLGVSGSVAETTEGKVASYTGATGAELEKQTQAVIAYGEAHGKSSEMVAKMLATEAGRAKIMSEANLNIAKSQETANTPAVKAQLIQAKLMETVGKLAMTLLNALNPVLDALMPIIDSLGDLLQSLLKPALDALTPALLALTPLLKLAGDLAGQLLTPVLKILSGIIQFLVDHAIAPLVQWLSVKVPEAVEKTIGFIKNAVAAVGKVVSAIGSFLGLGDKAADATKDAGKQVLDADKQNAEELARQKQIQQGQADQRDRIALVAKLAHGKISAEEEGRLRELAQDTQDDALLAKLDAFDAKKAKQGAASAKKSAKDKAEQAKAEADAEFDAVKDGIALKNEAEKKAKVEELSAEIDHAQKLQDIAEKFYGAKSQQFLKAEAQLLAAKKNLKAAEHADTIEDIKSQTDQILSDLETRSLKENLTDKQTADERLRITQESLKQEIDLRKSWGEDVSKLQAQYDQAALKHEDEVKKNRLKIQEEIAANDVAARKDRLEQSIQNAQSLGESTKVFQKQLTLIEEDGENERYQKELENRKDDLNDTKLGQALKESLEQNHQNKLLAIQQKAYLEQKKAHDDALMQQLQFFSGPFMQGMNKGLQSLFAGVNKVTQAWANSKNVTTQAFGTIAAGFIQMVEQMAEKALAYMATFELLNVLTGGGASAIMGTFNLAKQLIPGVGMAEGGVLMKPTVLRSGVMQGPTLLAAGAVIGGEAGPEAVLPLSSSRAQSQIGSALGIDKALGPLNDTMKIVAQNSAQTKVVQPMNNTFEYNRNRFLYAQRLRSRA